MNNTSLPIMIVRPLLLLTMVLALIIAPTLNSRGQQPEKIKKPKRTDNVIRMDGIRIGTDISRPFQSMWTKGDRFGGEVSADMEILPNLFPVVEAGWEKMKLDHDYISYTSAGPYIRIGADYNFLGTGTETTQNVDRHILYFGLRYAIGTAKQTVNSYTIDSYWGAVTGSFPSQNYNSQWVELVFGIKGEIFRNFFMGWSLRGKFNVLQKNFDMPPVYFNPGFGKAGSGNFDFTYSIYYTLPVRINFWKNKN